MVTIFPEIEHAGSAKHLHMVEKIVDTTNIPVIASLNAVHPETWIHYAGLLAETGVDALELNFYAAPTDPGRSGSDIEQEQVDIVEGVKKKSINPGGYQAQPVLY